MPVLEPSNSPAIFCLISLLCFSFLSARCAADELQTLLDLKTRLQSTNETLFDTWRPDSKPCEFAGVSCDLAGSITGIDLSGGQLSGPLPVDTICRLPSLQRLSLAHNFLSGNLKSDLRNCSNLLYLDLSFNALTGFVPDLSPLTKLQVLNLSQNGFSGAFPWSSIKGMADLRELIVGDNPFDRSGFPEEILGLTKMNSIYLSNCSLEGRIPSAIGNLVGLVRLELSTNDLTGGIPPEIGNLRNLSVLEIYENRLSGELPVGFGNLSNLAYFDASSNQLAGDLQQLKYFTKLVSLQLFNNQFTGGMPPEFGDFRELVNLSLYSNKLSGPLPDKLGSWAEFNFIDVSDNLLTGPIPPGMCKRGTMKKLLLLDNMFSGEIPATYGDCKTMLRFRVSNNKLAGQVPAKLWGLPNVNIIDLVGNNLEGPVTSDIRNAGKLGQLYLGNNKFSGGLPAEIFKAASLFSIDVRSNQFSGEIPPEIGELKQLSTLYLQNNMFSGPIPRELASCTSLTEVNLAYNFLSGEIPGNLNSLKTLNSINLSNNRLSGLIPVSLSSMRLSLLDLSNNQLSGPIPQALAIGAYAGSFDGNPGLCSLTNIDFRPCSVTRKSGHIRTLIAWFLAGLATLVVCLSCYIFVKKRKGDLDRRPAKEDSWNLKSFQVLTFTEQEILNAIKQDNLIGKGGSGSVYRVVLGNGSELAVKHIWNVGAAAGKISSPMLMKRPRGVSELEAEVATLSSIRHVNVVKLYCSITSEDSSLLVYDYMPNGSLWDRMHSNGKMELDWMTRYDVALGAAKGLEYLHHSCDRPILHRDVKSSNILLDEFFKPRIADFGLAKIVQANAGKDSTHVIAGTHGYIAPEYGYTYKVTEKSDVYSFGVVLLELVTGKRPIEPEFGENKDIVWWVSSKMASRETVMGVVDPRLPEAMKEEAVKVLRIAVLCTARLPALRPSMRTVVQLLEDAEPCKLARVLVTDGKGEAEKGMKATSPAALH